MLLPMFAMFMWIWVIILYALFHRIKAVRTRELHPKYFRTFSGATPPIWIEKQNRHITNLFECPPLFLIAGVLIIALKLEDGIFVALAWAFVALRIVHSIIHIGINHVIMRLSVFALSATVLVVIWARIVFLAQP